MKIAEVEVALAAENVCLGLVVARGCDPHAVVELDLETMVDDEAKRAARDMLRYGKYKPTGRGKPASEYLWQAAQEGQFPRINALVDLCNQASLKSGLPISLIDLARAATASFLVRRGRAGESYVFNAGGQTIALDDLLLTARMPADEPCANAVKDSLATKLGPEACDVLAVIYAPSTRARVAEETAKTLAEMYRKIGATATEGVLK